MRRREILFEHATWMIAAEDFGKSNRLAAGECGTRTQWI
jgi:hypothetical protein